MGMGAPSNGSWTPQNNGMGQQIIQAGQAYNNAMNGVPNNPSFMQQIGQMGMANNGAGTPSPFMQQLAAQGGQGMGIFGGNQLPQSPQSPQSAYEAQIRNAQPNLNPAMFAPTGQQNVGWDYAYGPPAEEYQRLYGGGQGGRGRGPETGGLRAAMQARFRR